MTNHTAEETKPAWGSGAEVAGAAEASWQSGSGSAQPSWQSGGETKPMWSTANTESSTAEVKGW